MDRKLGGLILALALAGSASAQNPQCDSYASAVGPRILFSNGELQKQYGFQLFSDSLVSTAGAVPFDTLAGKRAKFGKKMKGPYGVGTYREVITESCGMFYFNDVDDELDIDDSRLGTFSFLDAPPTEWKVTAKTDRMTDQRECVVQAGGSLPFPAFFFSSSVVHASVVGGDFPGKPHGFRVDKNEPITETDGLGAANTTKLIRQIERGGASLLTRSYRWPYSTERIKEHNLNGLSEKLDECKAWVR